MQLAPRPSLNERKNPEKTMARIDFVLMAFFGVLDRLVACIIIPLSPYLLPV